LKREVNEKEKKKSKSWVFIMLNKFLCQKLNYICI